MHLLGGAAPSFYWRASCRPGQKGPGKGRGDNHGERPVARARHNVPDRTGQALLLLRPALASTRHELHAQHSTITNNASLSCIPSCSRLSPLAYAGQQRKRRASWLPFLATTCAVGKLPPSFASPLSPFPLVPFSFCSFSFCSSFLSSFHSRHLHISTSRSCCRHLLPAPLLISRHNSAPLP